nr:DNA alkylation repair protein [Actinomycetota bacterium]
MDVVEKLIQRVQKSAHGFTDIKRAADEVVAGNATQDSLRMAETLFASEVHQARMLATLVLGRLAARSDESLTFLRGRVSRDRHWRVQEMLAQAFDKYCADIGYELALPVIEDWLADPNPNVRRAVTEGLRIWTSKPYFRDHPDTAIKLLSQLRDDDSEYVRMSVGNALRDISRKHKALVKAELQKWELSNKGIEQTYKLA